jgi:hypothetical protein
LFRSEKGEEWLPAVIETMAKKFSRETGLHITPQRIVIAAVHLLLFGKDDQGRHYRDAFTADPRGIRYRSETAEEEEFDDWLLRREQDFDH